MHAVTLPRGPRHACRGLLLALVALAAAPPAMTGADGREAPATPVRLVDHVRPLAKAMLERPREAAQVLEGPAVAAMRNDRSPGRTWMARLGGTTFRVTTQDASKVGVEHVLEQVQRLPARYRRCLEIVSEPQKDGVAVYADLQGAAAHGSQDYLNMIPAATVFVVLHEAGHILEQRATSRKPGILARWATAAAADRISVSAYGDLITHEDQAEFALVYGIALDAGPEHLEALKALSPRRFALWEEILALAAAPAPGAAEPPVAPKDRPAKAQAPKG
ncbi:MAG: hypothetical protein ACKOCB_08975 [Planctomycetia bacterium]